MHSTPAILSLISSNVKMSAQCKLGSSIHQEITGYKFLSHQKGILMMKSQY